VLAIAEASTKLARNKWEAMVLIARQSLAT